MTLFFSLTLKWQNRNLCGHMLRVHNTFMQCFTCRFVSFSEKNIKKKNNSDDWSFWVLLRLVALAKTKNRNLHRRYTSIHSQPKSKRRKRNGRRGSHRYTNGSTTKFSVKQLLFSWVSARRFACSVARMELYVLRPLLCLYIQSKLRLEPQYAWKRFEFLSAIVYSTAG